MDGLEVSRATQAVISIATSLGLAADDADVLHNSNKLALRIRPCEVFARVGPAGSGHAAFEIELARRLADAGCPVAVLEQRVEPRGYQADGFEVTLWTYYDAVTPEVPSAVYCDAMACLHAGMRAVDLPTPHFTDRIAQAERVVTDRARTPGLSDADRALLADTLRRARRAVLDHGAPEQLLHGEPHPGNLIGTASGPVFIDLETCCRGPVEFDLAHVPEAVSYRYPDVDHALLRDCRHLVLAMVAAWRWEEGDQFPNGRWFGRELLRVLAAGPPWPTLDELVGPAPGR